MENSSSNVEASDTGASPSLESLTDLAEHGCDRLVFVGDAGSWTIWVTTTDSGFQVDASGEPDRDFPDRTPVPNRHELAICLNAIAERAAAAGLNPRPLPK